MYIYISHLVESRWWCFGGRGVDRCDTYIRGISARLIVATSVSSICCAAIACICGVPRRCRGWLSRRREMSEDTSLLFGLRRARIDQHTLLRFLLVSEHLLFQEFTWMCPCFETTDTVVVKPLIVCSRFPRYPMWRKRVLHFRFFLLVSTSLSHYMCTFYHYFQSLLQI